LIFIGASTLPIAHIAPAVVAVFVEAINAGKVTTADVGVAVGKAQFEKFQGLMGSPVGAGKLESKI
jgi:hypothetical protein